MLDHAVFFTKERERACLGLYPWALISMETVAGQAFLFGETSGHWTRNELEAWTNYYRKRKLRSGVFVIRHSWTVNERIGFRIEEFRICKRMFIKAINTGTSTHCVSKIIEYCQGLEQCNRRLRFLHGLLVGRKERRKYCQ